MKKKNLLFLVFIFVSLNIFSQDKIIFKNAKFQTGYQDAWKERDFDDNQWADIKTDNTWDTQGYAEYDGYAVYRFRFDLPSSLLDKSYWKDSLVLYLGKIDDADEAYLNGVLIGKTGRFPSDKDGYQGRHNEERFYKIATNAPFLYWNKENIITVKVYDANSLGGMYAGIPYLRMVDLINNVNIAHSFNLGTSSDQECRIKISNSHEQPINGQLSITITDTQKAKIIKTYKYNIDISSSKPFENIIPFTLDKRSRLEVSFKDNKTQKNLTENIILPYVLTPEASESPQINGAKIFGVRPGSPFLFRIPASGLKPMKYTVENLPEGLNIDINTGIITGALDKVGEHKMTFVVENSKGTDKREFTVKVGDRLSLTPPMGWNSWNCWGLSVSGEKVRSSAQALIDKGLVDYGWSYINVDDAWENDKRDPDGTLGTNNKFPDMKGLGDWLHSNGLKFGIYSSPGPLTCGSYLGSYTFEKKDAETYAGWGVDYLKYDWCDYERIFQEEKDFSDNGYIKPFRIMGAALREQKRDILYSLCQYGMRDVWKWGQTVEGNLWRTTGDIVDTWQSLKEIGFDKQAPLDSYAGPGNWNDPDMLIVGKVGWGENLHPTRLTPDEQYAHISLWSLLASPLLIGCDISQMDTFTLGLLTNSEVIAINQDLLGKQAKRVYNNEDEQIWVKDLEDGSKAVGIFNLGDEDKLISIKWTDLDMKEKYNVRDVWQQKNIQTAIKEYKVRVPSHGVNLIRIY